MTTPDQLAQEARTAILEATRNAEPLGRLLCGARERIDARTSFGKAMAAIDAMADRIAELTKRAESAEALVKRYREALLTARDALACSYDVDSYPANGKTKQDKAIVAIDAAIQQEKSND